MTDQQPPDIQQAPPEPDEVRMDPRDIASAGRSCSAILILTVVIILVLCVGIALRWAFMS